MWFAINFACNMKLTLLSWLGWEIFIRQVKMYYTLHSENLFSVSCEVGIVPCYPCEYMLFPPVCCRDCIICSKLYIYAEKSQLHNEKSVLSLPWGYQLTLPQDIHNMCILWNFIVNRRSDFTKAKEGSAVEKSQIMCSLHEHIDTDANTDSRILKILQTLPKL